MRRDIATPDAAPHAGAVAAGLTAIVLAALAVRTVYRNAEYAKPLSLWGKVVERRPHGRARMALATEMVAAGDHAAALPQLREAVHDFPDARYALGTELVIGGKIDEGIAELRQFIQARPQHLNRIPARTLLAQALGLQNRFDDAADELRAIVKMVPDSEGVHTLLADMLFAGGKADEAAGEYRMLVARHPDDSKLESKLGATLLAAGRLNEATEHFQKALQLDPRSARAQSLSRRDVRASERSGSRRTVRAGSAPPRARKSGGAQRAGNHARLERQSRRSDRAVSAGAADQSRRCAGAGQSRAGARQHERAPTLRCTVAGWCGSGKPGRHVLTDLRYLPADLLYFDIATTSS